MGRHSCCQKQKLRKGLWSPEEDEKLVQCIASYGHGCWSNVPKLAGLERCGKSCRLRWKNYLRPDLKRGAFSSAEEKLIIDLHAIVGNRWSQIASQLPGRTDNEVKNFWNSCIKKKLKRLGIDPKTHKPIGSMTQNQTDQQANGASADSESPETSTDLNQQQSQGYKSVAESSGSESYRLNYMQCHEQGKMVSMNNEERACVEDSNTSNVDARLGWMLPNNAQSFSPEEGMIERFSFSKAPPVQAVHSFPEQQGPMLMLAGAPFNPNGVMAYLHGHGGPHLQVSPFDDSSGCRPVFQLEPKLGLYSSPSARNHELQFTPIFNSDSLARAPEISRPSPPPLPPRLQIFEDHNPGRQIEGPSFMVMDDFGISRGIARGNCYVKSETLDNNAVVVQEPSGWQYHIKNGVNEWQVCSPSDLHRIAAALDQI